MCSIVGAAGPIANLSSKLKQEFHEFMSCLFTMAEMRGRDAAGFWVWRGDHYVDEKRPLPAEDLIHRSPRWKGLRFSPGSLYLCHTRAATDGDPNDNINNHPHIGNHGVLIHNGMIWNHESIVKAEGLVMKSNCDSEVLLRLAEARDTAKEGLKHMFESVDENTTTASIAIAFVDRRTPDRIYLTRNAGNPCYIYKSERFNCTFFCSTEAIFEMALEMLYNTKSPSIIGAKSESIGVHELYQLHADGTVENERLVTLVQKYSTYSSGYNGVGNRSTNWCGDDEDDYNNEVYHYATVLINKRGYTVDISGNMSEILEEEEEFEADDEDVEFANEQPMPSEVEEDLRNYIQTKLAAQ